MCDPLLAYPPEYAIMGTNNPGIIRPHNQSERQPSMHLLRYPAPRRASTRISPAVKPLNIPSQHISHPYTEADVLRTLAYGGHFDFSSGQHDFETEQVRRFAREAQQTLHILKGA